MITTQSASRLTLEQKEWPQRMLTGASNGCLQIEQDKCWSCLLSGVEGGKSGGSDASRVCRRDMAGYYAGPLDIVFEKSRAEGESLDTLKALLLGSRWTERSPRSASALGQINNKVASRHNASVSLKRQDRGAETKRIASSASVLLTFHA